MNSKESHLHTAFFTTLSSHHCCWYSTLSNLATYDGIFHDTYGDAEITYFSSSLSSLVKAGAKVTWWNMLTTSSNWHNIENVDYEEMNINPPSNNYYNHNKYYLPKKQF